MLFDLVILPAVIVWGFGIFVTATMVGLLLEPDGRSEKDKRAVAAFAMLWPITLPLSIPFILASEINKFVEWIWRKRIQQKRKSK